MGLFSFPTYSLNWEAQRKENSALGDMNVKMFHLNKKKSETGVFRSIWWLVPAPTVLLYKLFCLDAKRQIILFLQSLQRSSPKSKTLNSVEGTLFQSNFLTYLIFVYRWLIQIYSDYDNLECFWSVIRSSLSLSWWALNLLIHVRLCKHVSDLLEWMKG